MCSFDFELMQRELLRNIFCWSRSESSIACFIHWWLLSILLQYNSIIGWFDLHDSCYCSSTAIVSLQSIVDSYNFLMALLKHNSFLCSRYISILLNRLLRDFCRTWVFLHLMFLVHCLNGPGVFQIIFLKTFKKFLIILWSDIVVLLLYKCGCIINIITLCYICFVWIIYFLY